LGDFGLTRNNLEESAQIDKLVASLYSAPELIEGKDVGKAMDLWTLGVLAYEMANYTHPFSLRIIRNIDSFRAEVNAEKERVWAAFVSD
jgi:hypothetical protein